MMEIFKDFDRQFRTLDSFVEDVTLALRNKDNLKVPFPKADIYDIDDTTFICLSVPGWTREKIDVSFANDVLSIHGESLEDIPPTSYLLKEIKKSSFLRRFRLSVKDYDVSTFTTTLENGILCFKAQRLKKTEEKKPMNIPIK